MNCDILPYLRAGDPSRIRFIDERRGIVEALHNPRVVWRFSMTNVRGLRTLWHMLKEEDLPMAALDHRATEYKLRALLSVAASAYLQGKVIPL